MTLTGAASRYQPSDDVFHTIALSYFCMGDLNLISGLSLLG